MAAREIDMIRFAQIVTVYCMNSTIFLCVTLKLFSLSFMRSSHQILAMSLGLVTCSCCLKRRFINDSGLDTSTRYPINLVLW